MKKSFMGVRLKRLREERNLTQQGLADAIGISLSYLNQIENNQRPLTVPVLLRLNAAFGMDVQLFSEDDDARLLGELREAVFDPAAAEPIATADLRELVTNMPALARAFIAQSRKLKKATEQASAYAARLGDDRTGVHLSLPSTPFEEVRDFFYSRHNYIDELDRAAETVAQEMGMPIGRMGPPLAARLETKHGLRLADLRDEEGSGIHRRFDAAARVLWLSRRLRPGQQAFQMATQLAFLEFWPLMDALVKNAPLSNDEARSLARIGLANYFAGALILPYRSFLDVSERLRYDIDLLGRDFGVGFETICHRLSTLQRPQARGVPFFFIRVDRAGNISKRQSATDFHFSRIGGTCPLWNVYDAFSNPGRVLRQVAEMPDGRAYLWIASMVENARGGFGAPTKKFAIALGCDLRYADRLVYSDGIARNEAATRTLIGAGCKVCERSGCPQRAFPPLAKTLLIEEQRSSFAPYSTA
ncbi:Cro/Cl family transcriptional regulator [Metarhizobium album]|uniref:Cro/Cl family transcriptional regulator n=1 Tax=Metarhizobium album TaxID=2182425 RepID=A0A2U2DNK7_9HYPH|nr:short-chain fatty acyl-CoA regulator family protein [Rhizobium album]PWE54897.1 Cro/Cl family transcriptional regulator [Rhizobium album]